MALIQRQSRAHKKNAKKNTKENNHVCMNLDEAVELLKVVSAIPMKKHVKRPEVRIVHALGEVIAKGYTLHVEKRPEGCMNGKTGKCRHINHCLWNSFDRYSDSCFEHERKVYGGSPINYHVYVGL